MTWKRSHKQFAAKRNQSGKGWRYVVVAGIVLVGLYFVLTFFYHKTHEESPTTYFAEKFSDWMAEHHKKPADKPKATRKAIASKQVTAPKIHFEFYKTLPKAEMPGKQSKDQSASEMMANAEQLEKELYEAANGNG